MTNLDEHKIYIAELGTDVVPLSVAKRAVAEAASHVEPKLDEAMSLIQDAFVDLNKALIQEEDND